MQRSMPAIAFVASSGFVLLFGLSCSVAAQTYGWWSDVPQDLSRSFSSLYYGFICTFVPYTLLGMLFGLLQADRHRSAVLTLASGLVWEKIGLFVLGAYVQGKVGYAWIAEELPFYVSSSVVSYIGGSLILGACVFYLGYASANRWGSRLRMAHELE